MQRIRQTNDLTGVVVLLAGGAVGTYFAARAGGAGAAALAALATVSAVLLALRAGSGREGHRSRAQIDHLTLALPGALIVYFAFGAGGYFPARPAVASIVLIVFLVLRITVVEEPFAGFSAPLAVAAGATGLLAGWTLLSAVWSDAPGRALVEFDRTFLYALVLILVGTVVRTSSRLRWLAASIATGALVVAVAALATRLAPDHFHTSIVAIGESNLAWPLTYSNALGILCVLGAIPCLYFATAAQEPPFARAAGCAALPVFSATTYLTLSRGPVAAAIVAIAAFVLLGRPRGLLTGAIAAVPASVVAVASAYQHPLLTSTKPQTAAAAAQGHRVGVVLIGCVLAAFVIRLVLTSVDNRLEAFSLPERSRRPVLAAGWVALVIAVLAVALATHAPQHISDQYHRFVSSGEASPKQDVRQSIFSSANRGLVSNWSVGLDAFKGSPLHGQGAGTYENYWNAHRPAKQASYSVVDAHSLYVETLGELGIVGFILILVVILVVLGSLLPVRRGPKRPLYAALFATALAWALHTGIDWDWEMPAVTVVFFALGGGALATHAHNVRTAILPQGARVLISLLLLAAAVAPALLFVSQRQLNAAFDALRAGDCARATDRAASAIDTLAMRAEPYDVLALCQSRSGRPGFGIDAARKAVEHDPSNWRYHYDLAALQGAAGLEPRAELENAHRLNPTDPMVKELLADTPKGMAVNWNLDLLGPSGASANLP